MPFRLHPSGYCVAFSDSSNENLLPGKACIFCGRVAGHALSCPESDNFQMSGLPDRMLSGKSSRGALFNTTSVLWHKSRVKSFITFTLPSFDGGVYQQSPVCESTGDIAITAKFSKVLEAYSLRVKRAWGEKISYVWVSEAQMERQEKFGGCGDIHFHLIINQRFKDETRAFQNEKGYWKYPFYDEESKLEFEWLQSLWCKHVGQDAANCVHVDPIPDDVNSIPSYLGKYLGKGSMRRIVSRRYASSQDLSKFKPITINHSPEATLIRRVEKDVDGYKVIVEYYSTNEILSHYGNLMEDESRYVGGSKGRARDLNDEQSKIRAENKASRIFWDGAIKCLNMDIVDTEIRPLSSEKKKRVRKKKLSSSVLRQQCIMGLSYST